MSQKSDAADASKATEVDKKKGAAAAPKGAPAPAAAAAGKKGAAPPVAEEPAIVRTEAEVEAEKNRVADEGIAIVTELWTRLARCALDVGDLRGSQNAACAAVNMIPESTTLRQVCVCVFFPLC